MLTILETKQFILSQMTFSNLIIKTIFIKMLFVTLTRRGILIFVHSFKFIEFLFSVNLTFDELGVEESSHLIWTLPGTENREPWVSKLIRLKGGLCLNWRPPLRTLGLNTVTV